MGSAITRRGFLAASTRTAAAIGAGSLLKNTARAAERTPGANQRLAVGLIGAGGRGCEGMRLALQAPNVVCAAAADVATFRFIQGLPAIEREMAKHKLESRIETLADYRRILDRKDIDAVLIATPDHWHFRQFVDALEAGKHIYLEKPMSKSIAEGDAMRAAARKHPDLRIQIGTQRRSGTVYLEARELIEQGKIGDIKFVRCYDCRNWVVHDPFAGKVDAKAVDWDEFQRPCEHKASFSDYRYLAWRWYWDYANGLLTDVGVHVMDVVHWLTGNSTPRSVVCNGGVYAMKQWETPDIVNAVWDYGTHSAAFTSNFANSFQGTGITVYGTAGTVEVIGHSIKVWEGDPGKVIADLPDDGGHMRHQANWIDAIRTGKAISAPVELGVSSLLPLHLAAQAYREGKKIIWDADSRKAVAV